MKIDLLVIDPQVDFCDPQGSLFVHGADKDMERLAQYIQDEGHEISNIHVTLDQHHVMDISHPQWFAHTKTGAPPAPFSTLKYALSAGVFIDETGEAYNTRSSGAHARTKRYLTALSIQGRGLHTIWPEHCLIGSPGACVEPRLLKALQCWESEEQSQVNYVLKGSNPWTEQFSAIQASVPQEGDPSTQTNLSLLTQLREADLVLVAGEALSHCVAETLRDILPAMGDPSKAVLLTDCTSSVPGWETSAEVFVDDMRDLGMLHLSLKDICTLINGQ